MMRTFDVYPKGEADSFKLKCDHFKKNDNGFVLYDEGAQISTDGFLSLPDVAAIIPEHLRTAGEYKPVEYLVYLKGRSSAIHIFAYSLKKDDDGRWVFNEGWFNKMTRASEERTVDGAYYIDTEEVIAILPADGLVHRER